MTKRRQTDRRPGPTNYDAWQDEVGKVVERPSPDVEREVEFHVRGPFVKDGLPLAVESPKVPFLSAWKTVAAFQKICPRVTEDQSDRCVQTHPVEHVPFPVDGVRPERQVQFVRVVRPAGEAEEARLLVERKPMSCRRRPRRRRRRRLRCHSPSVRPSLQLSPHKRACQFAFSFQHGFLMCHICPPFPAFPAAAMSPPLYSTHSIQRGYIKSPTFP